MLNSHSNPECSRCKHSLAVGCGTKLVDGKRTHITVYNCHRDSTPTVDHCKEKTAQSAATDKGGQKD
ncbi:MAG TPA: hypothetical protein DEP23_09390 [Ruminococcaceae bacterium]|jgi:hypothetical protein|nr:hypothetical protein [Oscillospiraceae bacterium]